MDMGGAEKQIRVLSEELENKNIGIQVVSLRPLGLLGEELIDSPVGIMSLDIEKNWELIYKFPIILHQIFKYQPSVIHGHMYHSNMLSRIFSILFPSVDSISTVHSTYETSSGDLQEVTIRELTYMATDILSDLTTFVSESSRRRYMDIKAVSEQKSTVIYNGIDTEEFQKDTSQRSLIRKKQDIDEEFVWLAAGRFAHAKDYPTMIQAFDQLSELDTELWILGKGELESEIKREIEEKNLTEQIKLLGTTDDVASYMNAADGFVLSSHWEGFSLVVAEAMACELPVVATKCGGPEEIIVNEETGYLCEVQDPMALAAVLERLMAQESTERKRMGKRGRQEIVDRFDLEEISKQWKTVYDLLHDC